MGGWRSLAGWLVAVSISLLCAPQARAQPVERNLPPAPQAPPSVIAPPPLPGSINDDRSLGVNLTAIVILGPTSPVVASPAPGVDATQVTRLDRPPALSVLKRFLGRPITRKLISQIETEIVREYRRQGFPFVEVSTPEQEISGGALQIRVVEFRVGKLTVSHAGAQESAQIERQVRTQPGDEIDSQSLLQDLDWLNRYPGRVVTPTFTPGAALGQTDLDLVVSRPKPWSISAGYANSGSPATGLDRYYLGGSLGGHLLTDEFLSVQVTGSPDFWGTEGRLFNHPEPLYESAAGRLVVATAPRQDIELTVNAVQTNETVTDFLIRQQTVEATLGYRGALSNVVPLPGDVSFGMEASRQGRHTFFGGVEVVTLSVDVFQFFGDWSDHWSDRFGTGSADISVHGSPGGLDRRNTDAAFASDTNGRVLSATYVYGAADIAHQTPLPFGLALSTDVSGQYAGRPLPDSQQIAIGGQTAVRGYTLDDGAWDDGVVVRNELRPTPVAVIRSGPLAADIAPLAFVDAGYGHDEGIGPDAWMTSAGFGADMHVGGHALAGFDLAWPLLNAKVTRADAVFLDARVSLAF
jgi:hemolysin activation/secretion protein